MSTEQIKGMFLVICIAFYPCTVFILATHKSTYIVDTFFLKSLKKRQVKSGYSEIIKHSLIKDKKFFCWLEENYKKILNLQNPFILNAIFKSIKIKADIVKKDEKESLALSGSRVLLNFGHTIGHAIEANNSYKNNLTHGEAISIGMITASRISYKLNYLSNEDFTKIKNHFTSKRPSTNPSRLRTKWCSLSAR